MPQHGRIIWNELNTHDPEGAKVFYASVFGWTFDAMPMDGGGTYWVAKAGSENVGGLFTMAAPAFDGIPDHWIAYLSADDVDATVARITAHGGAVIRPPWTAQGVGRIAIVRDPGSAVLAIMTPEPRP